MGSVSDDNEGWDSDETTEAAAGVKKVVKPKGESSAGASSSSLVGHFVAMGFSKEMVAKAMKQNGEGNSEAILESLLTYAAIGETDGEFENPHSTIGCSTADVENGNDDFDDDDDDGYWDGCDDSDGVSDTDFDDKDFLGEMSAKDKKILKLVEMGFTKDEAIGAIDRCGNDASESVLADSIYAAQTQEGTGFPKREFSDDEDYGSGYGYRVLGADNSTKFLEDVKKRKRRCGNDPRAPKRTLTNGIDGGDAMVLPNPMIGFGLPTDRIRPPSRRLPSVAMGPPYFYYENVALAPKGVWDRISRFLYDIEPEFVDSKYFCAAARKRGYIHNLPLENRFPLRPTPPKTIHEAFPGTKRWWPSWDPRKQFNCLQTCIASARLTERIRRELSQSPNPPTPRTQQYVLHECRKWNLVWVGLHKLAPLEPDEIEFLLGFPPNHTRGVSRTERYRSLGNSFQVDTVAYHLSVLKDMFPNGMTVLSLFSGIGGAEVALHRLGIHMKTVVSVEVSEVNRTILRSWWDQTNQTGTLIEVNDVQMVSGEKLEQLIRRFGGFDLVIGGSPCNNLAGSNRHHRDGLDGEQSSLFYDYFRILDLVKKIMASV